ncbi:MAG: AraC family transcriptional regulator [Muribaculaceae bacterium]|nr:AraC family transcriptional regulator [Muribaculaceae bacterium]
MEKELNLNDITNISSISESFSHAGQDYIFSHILFDENVSRRTAEPVRFKGITVVVVLKGSVDIMISSNTYHMDAGTITVMGPNDIISTSKSDGSTVELYTLFLSAELLGGVNFDVNIINPRYIIDHDPVLRLNSDELRLICGYLHLLHQCAVNNNDAPQQLSLISRSIGRNIVVALMYQLAFLTEKRHLMSCVPETDGHRPVRSRKVNYVHEFMRLLQQHYRKERTVSFYAGQLCISPKYLSLLVREVTGRTAAAIIDQFVINEAKNMLRFSGYTIQQVAYKLNFPNQSAFGKYFKHITGVSPTSFRSN